MINVSSRAEIQTKVRADTKVISLVLTKADLS